MKLLNLNIYAIFLLVSSLITYLNGKVLNKSVSDTVVKKPLEIDASTQTFVCPLTINKTGVYVYADTELCNIYHECSCTFGLNVTCAPKRSFICPSNEIFLDKTKSCGLVETTNCTTAYLEYDDNHHFQNETISETNEKKKLASLVIQQIKNDRPAEQIDDLDHFKCPPGANNRYIDLYICNIFHVCVTRGNHTYDQPFLCPYSTVFRIINSTHMYCDKKKDDDCVGKAFYMQHNEEVRSQISPDLLINSTKNATFCNVNGIFEDTVYCNVYHRCSNGVDERYMCENQLVYNPLSTICDYPINVDCGRKLAFKRSTSNQTTERATYNTEVKLNTTTLAPTTLSKVKSQPNKTSNIIFGVKIDLNCPITIKNALLPDSKYCNIFHQCHSGIGSVLVCETGEAFDANANGVGNSGVCNYEEMVDCSGKLILTENGVKIGKAPKSTHNSDENSEQKFQGVARGNFFSFHIVDDTKEELVTGIQFDCRGKPNGHWQDTMYCDIFHACINGEQRKTYKCAQMSERNYFDEHTKKCEFTKSNPSQCKSNQYYQQIVPNPNQPSVYEETSDSWKLFVRSREPFSCAGRADGFYSSRWCNVFYRCSTGTKTEFLCPKMANNDRLWWMKHRSPQEIPQESVACVWPCETKQKCESPGGLITEVVSGIFVESFAEVERIWQSANCEYDETATDLFKLADGDLNCVGLPEGSFHASKYCNVFHRCAGGKRRDFICAKATNSPYELWWNQATQSCDWPCKVNCVKPVYGSQKTAAQIQEEDRFLNEGQCKEANNINTVHPIVMVSSIVSKPISRPYPDETYMCPGRGYHLSAKACNVYYECNAAGQYPVEAFYCENGYFDNISKTCKPTSEVDCPLNPAILYPIIPIPEQNNPENVVCSTIGYYIIHSHRFCNLFYVCDGKTTRPQAFRCYDRLNLEDGLYNKEKRRCETRNSLTSCSSETFSSKQRYQSIPVDFKKFPELQILSCRADQQYLAEHEKYCNLYHSCILGRYQMFACINLGGYEKTSYFYYANGECAAPLATQCGPNKTIFPYEILLSIKNLAKRSAASVDKSAVSNSNFGFIPLKSTSESFLECESSGTYVMPHKRYCNLFYECNNGKLKINICIDKSTNLYSGIFDKTIGACKPYNANDCPNNLVYNPEDSASTYNKPNITNQGRSNFVQIFNVPSFATESTFSCLGRLNGYYESEWCNIFFRCLNGKRIDIKCSAAAQTNGDLIGYDLWWEHQNGTYDQLNPKGFFGLDEEAKCEWPCKVRCQKRIWPENGRKESADIISTLDTITHPGCAGSKILFQEASPRVFYLNYRAYEIENMNPSGFFCQHDGTFNDPLFCNIYHVCVGRQRKSFMCKELDTDGRGKSGSIFDYERKICIPKAEGLSKCKGILYDPNYVIVPAYHGLKFKRNSCDKTGVQHVHDGSSFYCDLFYWCERPNAEPLYFHCSSSVFGTGLSFFNAESKQCDSELNVYCPYPNKLFSAQRNVQSQQSKPLPTHVVIPPQNLVNKENPHLMEILAGILDPAPGHISIPANEFHTSFTCQNASPGYYPNPEYCDLFHYCFSNGHFKTYVCTSMQNRYQLWWNHQTESGRHDNIFCDFPCKMTGSKTFCPSHKRVFMRDRQQILGGITQQEVLLSICTNAGPLSGPIGINLQPFPATLFPTTTESSANTLNTQRGYYDTNHNHHCTHLHSNEWFASPPTIRCTVENRIHGFVPDPRDCSKYYRCDQNVGIDSMSTGYLVSCIAGLWWDQSRRMCALPSEVKCDPYKIINEQGIVLPPTTETKKISSKIESVDYGKPNILDSGSSLCKFITCAQAGLSMKQQMRSVPGRSGVFYKCDGQCAIEMKCPLDLVFDDFTQRCEWPGNVEARLASLKTSQNDQNKVNRIIVKPINESNNSRDRNPITTNTIPINENNVSNTTNIRDETKSKHKRVKLNLKPKSNAKQL